MRKGGLTASLMLSVVLLAAAIPALGVSAASGSSSETTAIVSSFKGTSQTAVSKASNDRIQSLKTQTMILKKIVVKDKSIKNQSGVIGTPIDQFHGINNSTFKVYDVTSLMQQILKEKLKTDIKVKATMDSIDQAVDSNSVQDSESNSSSTTSQSTDSSVSESNSSSSNNSSETQLNDAVKALMKGDSLKTLIADRAAKLNANQLKLVTTVKTMHDAKTKSDGVARVTVPIDGQYHAYYIVNTDTPQSSHVTNADPLVVITPITEDDGLYADSFTLYPKSDNIPQKQSQDLKKVTTTRLYQTGNKPSQSLLGKLIAVVWNMF